MQRIRIVKRWEFTVMTLALALPIALTVYSILIAQFVLALALGISSAVNIDLFYNSNRRPKEIPYIMRPYLMLEAAYFKRAFDPKLRDNE